MIYEAIDLHLNDYQLETQAKLECYRLDDSHKENLNKSRPAIIICPGGGYQHRSLRESEPIAMRYLAAGYHAFVLQYHVAPNRYPVALFELASAVKLIREHAIEWNINENQIILNGFSAGGHLTASLSCLWNEDFIAKALNTTCDMIRPNGCILSYPVITSGEYTHKGTFQNLVGDDTKLLDKLSLENQVNEDTPPMFIWATFEDKSVPVENSLLFVWALRKHNISTEFHMYPHGGHGLALANQETQVEKGNKIITECQDWINLAIRWINQLGGEQC